MKINKTPAGYIPEVNLGDDGQEHHRKQRLRNHKKSVKINRTKGS
jgi:hypothetical protein